MNYFCGARHRVAGDCAIVIMTFYVSKMIGQHERGDKHKTKVQKSLNFQVIYALDGVLGNSIYRLCTLGIYLHVE